MLSGSILADARMFSAPAFTCMLAMAQPQVMARLFNSMANSIDRKGLLGIRIVLSQTPGHALAQHCIRIRCEIVTQAVEDEAWEQLHGGA